MKFFFAVTVQKPFRKQVTGKWKEWTNILKMQISNHQYGPSNSLTFPKPELTFDQFFTDHSRLQKPNAYIKELVQGGKKKEKSNSFWII